MHFIIANAAKHDLDELSLVQEVQQLGLPKENSDAIGRQYREHKVLQTFYAFACLRVSTLTDYRSSHTPNRIVIWRTVVLSREAP